MISNGDGSAEPAASSAAAESEDTAASVMTSTNTSVAGPTATSEEETKKHPIDLPPPVLLSTSMVLAIASTGSMFELLGGGDSGDDGASVALCRHGGQSPTGISPLPVPLLCQHSQGHR